MNIDEIRANAQRNSKFLLKYSKLTQQQYANLIGVQRPTFAAMTEGRSLSVDMINRVCEYEKITLDDFLKSDISKLPKFIKERKPFADVGLTMGN